MSVSFDAWRVAVRDELFRQGDMTFEGAQMLVDSVDREWLRDMWGAGLSAADAANSFWEE